MLLSPDTSEPHAKQKVIGNNAIANNAISVARCFVLFPLLFLKVEVFAKEMKYDRTPHNNSLHYSTILQKDIFVIYILR